MTVVVDTTEMCARYHTINSFTKLTNQFKADSQLLCSLFTANLITADQLSEMQEIIVKAYTTETAEIQ